MKTILFAAVAATAVLASASAMATTITGSIMFGGPGPNYYDPANGFVPAGFDNATQGITTTIDGNVEYGFADGANTDTADFTGTSLIVTDLVHSSASSWIQTFTASQAGFFNNIQLTSSNFAGFSYSVAANTLTVNWQGANAPAELHANFTFDGAGRGVPEPATWAMMLMGFGGLGAVIRRRKHLAVA